MEVEEEVVEVRTESEARRLERLRLADTYWNQSRDASHMFVRVGTHCARCWGWIDDPRHT